MTTGYLTPIDYAVIGVYLAGLISLGVWLAKRQTSREDYFVAGRRLGWFILAISVWVSLCSANTMLGAPGYAYAHDLQLVPEWWFLGFPTTIIVVFLVLPVFHGLRLTTVYGYLERRYGLPVRIVGAVLFILLRGGWMATVMYAPSVALSAVVNVPVWAAILVLGLLATVYTTLGGILADIYSDVAQFFIFAGGLALIWFYVLRDVGGWQELWSIGVQTGHTYPLTSGREFWSWMTTPKLDPKVQIMFVWVLLGQTLNRLNDIGIDQMTLQRYFSARSLKHSLRALWISTVMDIPMLALLYLSGLGIFVYFHVHGAQFPFRPENADQMLPYFVSAGLPVGISGLFIAALLAATMSSVDSGINCLSATVITDFYRRLRGPEGNEQSRPIFDKLVAGGLAVLIVALGLAAVAGVLRLLQIPLSLSTASSVVTALVVLGGFVVALAIYTKLTSSRVQRFFARIAPESADEAHYLRASRYVSLTWGLVATVTALFLGQLGQIYIICIKVMGFWTGPLLGIFLLALFTRRATAKGVIIGAVAGAICTTIWARYGFTAYMYHFVGLLPTLLVGYLVSIATGPPKPEQIEGLTVFTRRPRPVSK